VSDARCIEVVAHGLSFRHEAQLALDAKNCQPGYANQRAAAGHHRAPTPALARPSKPPPAASACVGSFEPARSTVVSCSRARTGDTTLFARRLRGRALPWRACSTFTRNPSQAGADGALGFWARGRQTRRQPSVGAARRLARGSGPPVRGWLMMAAGAMFLR